MCLETERVFISK
ncbi:hypothetical protein CP8484711_0277A, partial [Chlamydia psittaci 84-8471/1]